MVLSACFLIMNQFVILKKNMLLLLKAVCKTFLRSQCLRSQSHAPRAPPPLPTDVLPKTVFQLNSALKKSDAWSVSLFSLLLGGNFLKVTKVN